MRTVFGSLILLILAAFSGCDRQNVDNVTPVSTNNLIGKWVLSNPDTGFVITLNIELKRTDEAASVYRFTGQSPINEYSAEATVQTDGSVVLSSVGGTKRGGTIEEMKTEQAYYANLSRVFKISLVDGKLKLLSSDAQFSLWSTLLYDRLYN